VTPDSYSETCGTCPRGSCGVNPIDTCKQGKNVEVTKSSGTANRGKGM
jgi:hypothetical protein